VRHFPFHRAGFIASGPLALLFALLLAGLTISGSLAQATPVSPPAATRGEESAGTGLNAAQVNGATFGRATYSLLAGTTTAASLTITMTGSTSGTAELFGLGRAVPVGPASVSPSGGGTCNLNQQPTGGTVQVVFGSTTAGSCTISFTITDTGAGAPFGTIVANIAVNYIPREPVTTAVEFVQPLTAGSPSFTVPYGQAYTGILPAFGGKAPYSFTIQDQPSSGTMTITNPATGAFSFSPAPGQFGVFTFVFGVTDSTDASQGTTGTATLNIAAPPPLITTNLNLAVAYEGSVSSTIAASGGTPPFSFAIDDQAEHGTVDLNVTTGDFTYAAGTGAVGPDSFTVTITDNGTPEQSTTATVTLTIAPKPLSTSNLDLDVAFEGSVDSVIPATGGTSPLHFVVSDPPVKGSVDLDDASGAFTYTAGTNQTGTGSFQVTITDSGTLQQSAISTVNVTIGDPDALHAQSVTLNIAAGATTTGTLQSHVSGGFPPYSFVVATGPVHGDLTLDADGTYSYTAQPTASGPDTFTYVVTDSEPPGVSAAAQMTGSVLIMVEPAANTPTPTATATSTPSPTSTSTPTPSPTATPSQSSTSTPTPDSTETATATPDPTATGPATGSTPAASPTTDAPPSPGETVPPTATGEQETPSGAPDTSGQQPGNGDVATTPPGNRAPDPGDVSQLPATGQGRISGTSLTGILAGLALVLGALAMTLRRKPA